MIYLIFAAILVAAVNAGLAFYFERRLTRAEADAAHYKLRSEELEKHCIHLVDERNLAVQTLQHRIGQEVCGTWVRPAFGNTLVKAGKA